MGTGYRETSLIHSAGESQENRFEGADRKQLLATLHAYLSHLPVASSQLPAAGTALSSTSSSRMIQAW